MQTIEDRNKRMREWYYSNRDQQLERRRQYSSDNHAKILLYACKKRAEKKGIPFNLGIEDVVIPVLCPLLGTPLTKIQGKGKVDSNASIDRIDPTLGYVKGNVWVISHLANRMKNSATIEQLITFSKKVLIKYDNV